MLMVSQSSGCQNNLLVLFVPWTVSSDLLPFALPSAELLIRQIGRGSAKSKITRLEVSTFLNTRATSCKYDKFIYKNLRRSPFLVCYNFYFTLRLPQDCCSDSYLLTIDNANAKSFKILET